SKRQLRRAAEGEGRRLSTALLNRRRREGYPSGAFHFVTLDSRRGSMRRSLVVMALAMMVGCVDDPQDPKTWIKKLGDVREGKEAVTNLVRLKDPSAVEPLVAVYKKSKDPDVLKAIASFHDQRQVPAMVDAM